MDSPSPTLAAEQPSSSSLLSPLTNYERWMLFMKECPAPTSYIQFGWYYMVAAALQRRVWTGDLHKPLYPNLYIVPVGPSGVGKGLVISQIDPILREHKLKVEPSTVIDNRLLDTKKKMKEVETMLLEGNSTKEIRELKDKDQPLVIPVAANSTTYQALTKAMAGSVRYIKYKNGEGKMVAYGHSSICFCLQELGSLVREHTKDIINFLQEAYDCGDRYEYDTKTQGKDVIRKMCLNFFAGTTPEFMTEAFNSDVLNQGFASRSFFIYETRNRFNKLISVYPPEHRQPLVEHIRLLTTLYGQARFSDEAFAFLTKWWEIDQDEDKDFRANHSSKLDAYYARKQIHTMKLATVLHFSEVKFTADGECSMIIEKWCCVRALEILAKIEKKMHLALTFGGDNPHYKVGQRILKHMKRFPEGLNFNALLIEFYEYAKKDDLTEILYALGVTGKIVTTNRTNEKTGETIDIIYRLPNLEDQNLGD